MKIVEKIIPVGQVATPKEIRIKLEDARKHLSAEVSERCLVPAGDYRFETFALSSCIYARASIEVMSATDAEKSHAA